MRIVEKRDLVDRRHVREAEHVAHLHVRDVDLDVLRHVGRQRFDVELARDEREHAARLDAGRLADELDDDRRVDRLVEANLAQVDVRDRAADRILLVLGENRRMHGRLTLDDDVENRVEPRRAGHDRAKLPLGNDDRARVTLPVQNAGDEPLRAEAPGVTRAESSRSRTSSFSLSPDTAADCSDERELTIACRSYARGPCRRSGSTLSPRRGLPYGVRLFVVP